MSLILAEAASDDGFFVADTLLTYKFQPLHAKGPFNGKSHALKVHILNNHFCMAIAGEYPTGLSVVNQTAAYLREKNLIDETVIEKINALYKQSCEKQRHPLDACDFLVMFNKSGKVFLFKISNGIISSVEKAYIGNDQAYKQLRSLQLQYPPLPHQTSGFMQVQQENGTFKAVPFQSTELEKNFLHISDVMERVSPYEDVAIIGNSLTRVRINKFGNFKYLQQAKRGSSPEEGDIGISLLSSTQPKYGIGIFYQSGGFGDLFIAGDTEHCRRIKSTTIDDFIKISAQDYSLTLIGATW